MRHNSHFYTQVYTLYNFAISTFVTTYAWNLLINDDATQGCRPWDTSECLSRWPLEAVPDIMKPYFTIQIMHYVMNTFIEILVPSQKHDRMMPYHHMVTLLLLLISYSHRLHRIGLLVHAIFDASTPFLFIAKYLNNLKKTRRTELNRCAVPWEKYAFGVFAVAFFIFRVALYPVAVLHTTLFDSHVKYNKDYIPRSMFLQLYSACNTLLLILYYMQLLWFIRIIGMLRHVKTE